jgi:hypothetical protein
MALLSCVDSTPRAYRLKAGNAARKVSTDAGTSPERLHTTIGELMEPLEPTFPGWIRGLHAG